MAIALEAICLPKPSVRDRRRYTPTLKLSNFNLSESDLDDVFDAGSILGIGSKTLRRL